jgi:hypothetical protein
LYAFQAGKGIDGGGSSGLGMRRITKSAILTEAFIRHQEESGRKRLRAAHLTTADPSGEPLQLEIYFFAFA